MSTAVQIGEAISALVGRFAGRLVQPADPEYDSIRRIHNGLIDRRPALIARCAGVADVIAAVALARAHGLEIAVRGGGHSLAGRSTVDEGVVIDLSLMRGVIVDPGARVARAQGGATWGLFDRETQVYGLAATGGVMSTTGIAGLTLGGGLGFLIGKCGLAIDSLQSAQIVTADGRVLQASDTEHPDLFWALRGGGGNFGIVTMFEYRLHSIGPIVTGGIVAYTFDRAPDVLRLYRDLVREAPDELTIDAGLLHAPDGSKIVALAVCHCGSLEDGARAAEPLASLGSPVMQTLGPLPYVDVNAIFDPAFPKGALNYWKSSFLRDFSDDAIAVLVDRFARTRSPMSQIALEYMHGAAVRVAPAATAFPHREPDFNLLVLSQWTDPAYTEEGIAWARETYASMAPFLRAGGYVNYQSEAGADTVAAAYGDNYARLQAVKAAYDPQNIFHLNHNISVQDHPATQSPPARAGGSRPRATS
jgi:FAD/FMN-containing dehydrogenase